MTAPLIAAICVLSLGTTGLAQDQITYRNTQNGRPVTTEDAYAVDRYSLDLHVAPVTVERSSGGEYRWTGNPEIVYGLLPRTQIEMGVPLVYQSGTDESRLGVAGVTLGALYNFNAETRGWPALGLRAGVLIPAGGLGPERAHPSLTMLGTRTLGAMRVHVNTGYAFRDEPVASIPGLARWTTGVAVDRSFPFAALLVAAEAFGVRPFGVDQAVQWNAGIGARYQFTPNMTADAGIGRRLTGANQEWSISLGVGRAMGVRSLLPGFGRWGSR